MTEIPTNRVLCESVKLQADLLRDAYESGDPGDIDDALIRVDDARRMVKNGMYDLIYGDELSAPDEA